MGRKESNQNHHDQLYTSVYALMLWTTMSHHNQLYTSVYALMLWTTISHSKFRNTINTEFSDKSVLITHVLEYESEQYFHG